MMAAQEYEGMKEQLDLEQNLRVKAESYAHEVKEQATVDQLVGQASATLVVIPHSRGEAVCQHAVAEQHGGFYCC